MAGLKLHDVTAGYDGADVLHSVSLEVPDGQLLCVLGPSGGGKSTLLRVIAGLESPRSGSVVLDGRDLADVPAHERGIGLMFQDYALFPHRNVGDNVGFGLRMRGVPVARRDVRVRELLELVGLPGAERRSVAQLSGGEQQRVALARALAPEPQVLLLDEPMGSLDRSLRERLPGELREIFARLGLTAIYVTHDQDEALTVADQVALLHAGAIVAEGSPEALWTAPPTAWAARFLGARNVTSGVIDGDVVRTTWGALPLPEGPVAAVDGGGVTVVIRPSGLVLVPDGTISGRVVERRFAGDHILLTVAAMAPGGGEADGLIVEVRAAGASAIGDHVGLRILAGALHLIPDPEPLPLAHA